MFVVVVDFTIKDGMMDAFLQLMIENAQKSRETEPGCQLFDVCREGNDIFLYEIYDDRPAFDAHLATDHFKSFDAAVAEMVAHKSVRTFDEVHR